MRGIPAPETAANAIGRHKVMIAVEPATMVPTKKIKPKTKKLGMGSASNNPGKAVITLVCVKRSLKIITTKVLMTIRASNADRKNGFVIAAEDGLVEIDVLQWPGKSPVSARDFLLGHTVKTGQVPEEAK